MRAEMETRGLDVIIVQAPMARLALVGISSRSPMSASDAVKPSYWKKGKDQTKDRLKQTLASQNSRSLKSNQMCQNLSQIAPLTVSKSLMTDT
jgi:hypothetical protein